MVRRSDVECDVRDPAAVEQLAERTYRDIGPVRLLVNNAGVEQFGYLWDTPVDNWKRVVDINVSGVFHGIRAFVPRMIDAGAPAWVWNLSSIGGVAVVPLQAPYIMSKHAVLALTECLHLEIQHARHDHIHVQAVLPGAVVSNIFESAGGVSEGELRAAESQRDAMLDIKAGAMDPLAAARSRCSSKPPKGGSTCSPSLTMSVRRWPNAQKSLSHRQPPALRSGRRFDPGRQ